jgi:hypothetical protein
MFPLRNVISPIELFTRDRTGAGRPITTWTPHRAQRRRLLPSDTLITPSVITTSQIGHRISGTRSNCQPSRWKFLLTRQWLTGAKRPILSGRSAARTAAGRRSGVSKLG